MDNFGEVVLLTGGSGFLGQHIVKELQVSEDLLISAIRIVDLKAYENILGHKERLPVNSYKIDIINKESLRDAFLGVTCVIHCAAFISYEYPVDWKKLWTNNVEGTSNIVDLCLEYNVPKLIFTSTAEVSLVPYIGSSCVSVIINQTEKRAAPDLSKISGYAASKLEAERIVLKSNNMITKNGSILKTVSLRPVLIYGEGDENELIMWLFRISQWMGGSIPRIAGTGGKHQMVYAGNVAWSHVCAMKTLKKESEVSNPNKNVAGLPVFITDDTTLADVGRIFERLTKSPTDGKPLMTQSWWSVPIAISFLLAVAIQTISKVTNIKLKVPPCGLINYLGSFVFFNRLRASLCLDFSPVYSEEYCYWKSSEYYRKMYKFVEKEDYFKKYNFLKK